MSSKLCRRDVLAGGLGALSLASCNRASTAPAPVAILRAPSYSQELYETVRRLLSLFPLNVRGKKVVLKPNLVEFDPLTAVNTHPLLIHAAMETFRALGADVQIAEGPGHRRITLDMAEAAGYFDIIPGFESLFTDLNLDEVARVVLQHPQSRLRELHLPRTVLDCDLLVSMPKMKTHHWVVATLSTKNLFGVVPGAVYGWPKNILHWAGINESIADLHRALPRRFAIVDGIVGMEGNGPIQGRPKQAGVLVAGADSLAVDSTCCRIMGIDPTGIHYLRLAETRGQTSEAHVRQVGELIEAVRAPFDLIPQFHGLRLAAGSPG